MKKIKIGQIGIGHNHGAAKAADLRRLSDIYDFVGIVVPEHDREYFSRRYLDEYKDIPVMSEEELFCIADLDAVLIETCVPYLVPTARRAIDHGLHIHLDKPAGEDIAEYEQMLSEAEAKGLAVQMGYMYRYNPGVLYALDQIERGELGDIMYIDAHMSTGHDEKFRKYLSQFTGGTMYIFGCHLIDLIVKIKGRPERIVSFNTNSHQDGIDFPDNCAAALVYKDGTCFVRTSSVEVNGWGRRQFVVCGTKGTIEIKPIESPMSVTQAYAQTAKPWRDIHSDIFPPKQEHRYINMLCDFAKIIRGEEINKYTYEHDLYVHKATLAACGFDIEL